MLYGCDKRCFKSTFRLGIPTFFICFICSSKKQAKMLSSESKDNPLGELEEQTNSDNFFPLVSVTMTLSSLTYATFLPQNDEQMKGLFPFLAYGILDLIENHYNEKRLMNHWP